MKYNKDDFYLYPTWGSNYKVGHIEKVNTKSIRMNDGERIPLETFDKVTHKLTEEEVRVYKGELIAKLSYSQRGITDLYHSIQRLHGALNQSDLVQVDVNKVQAKLDKLEQILQSELPQAIKLGRKTLKFNSNYTTMLEEV